MRERTATYLVDLAEATRDFGGDLMVFGSPKQRSLLSGVEWQQGFDYATETFRRAMPGIDANRRVAVHGAARAVGDRLHQHG